MTDPLLNREIKAYCPDFVPIRRILRDLGAVFIEVKEQVDIYYHLPVVSDDEGTRWLKLRFEKGKRQLIYYVDSQEAGARTSRFQLWDIDDLQIEEALDAALGAKAIVRKQRELWRKENVIFNLDVVEGVGQILEVEVQNMDGHDINSQIEEFHRLMGPFLDRHIEGSNEDLIAAAERSRDDSSRTS